MDEIHHLYQTFSLSGFNGKAIAAYYAAYMRVHGIEPENQLPDRTLKPGEQR